MLVATVAPAGVLPRVTVESTFGELGLNWPGAASGAIAALGGAHRIELPVASVESALRNGTMVVTWRQLCDWVVPPAPALAPSAGAETPIDIPLRAITRAYLALRAQATPGPSAGTPSATTPPSPTEPPSTSSDTEVTFTTYKPSELLDRVCALPGIQGAVIASNDGLVLAARLNPGLDAETVAAFLPKLMAPALESAKLLQIGDPESVVYAFAGVTLVAVKLDGLLLAAVGQTQQTMALDRLRLVARYARLG